jgi:hypothetical protein
MTRDDMVIVHGLHRAWVMYLATDGDRQLDEPHRETFGL